MWEVGDIAAQIAKCQQQMIEVVGANGMSVTAYHTYQTWAYANVTCNEHI
jgi:hypothetical protein